MVNYVNSYIHPSKELSLFLFDDPPYVIASYGDLKGIDAKEYTEFLSCTGDFLQMSNTGRLLADFSALQNFSVDLMAVAINNFRSLISDRTPYLLLAIVSTNESWRDPAMHLALELAKPLSRKFLDGQIFKKKDEALHWLLDYPVPAE
jgi:hypothetical protein